MGLQYSMQRIFVYCVKKAIVLQILVVHLWQRNDDALTATVLPSLSKALHCQTRASDKGAMRGVTVLDGAGMGRGPGQVGFGTARRIETDNRGESGEQREVEHVLCFKWVVGWGRDG